MEDPIIISSTSLSPSPAFSRHSLPPSTSLSSPSLSLSLSPASIPPSSSIPSPSISSATISSSISSYSKIMRMLMDILEGQEVSLFSISVDDVDPKTRPFLQAAKSANMKAKDLVSILSNSDSLPSGDHSSYTMVRMVSLPSYSSASLSSHPNHFRYSLDPNIISPSLSLSSSPSPSLSLSSSPSPSVSSPSSTTPAAFSRKTPPPSPTSLSLSSSRSIPPSPTTPSSRPSLSISIPSSSPPDSPSISPSLPPSSPSLSSSSQIPSSPSFAESPSLSRSKSKFRFFKWSGDSKLNKSSEVVDCPPPPPQARRKRGFSIFHNSSPSSPSSSSVSTLSSSSLSSSSPSKDKASLRKSISLPATAYTSISCPPSPSASNFANNNIIPPFPSSPSSSSSSSSSISTPTTPTSKKDRAGYNELHEQSKLLFSKKLESLRASQGGDV